MVDQILEKGYKLTELGTIPEEWAIQNILDNSILKARIGWQGLTTNEYLNSGNFCLITGTDFNNGKIDWNTCVYVDENRYSQDRNIQLKVNDILVTKDGTIGKIAYIRDLPFPTTLNSGVFVIRPKKKSYYPLFLFYILSSNYFIQFLNKLQAGSTINHLYQKDFASFSFVIPELPEQEKIAIALSDVDYFIMSLDRLIEKKKNIRQSTIRELLSGKKRLPGFDGNWETRTIGNEIDLLTGFPFPSNKYASDGTRLLRGSNIKRGKTDWSDEITEYWQDVSFELRPYLLREGDIVVAMDGSLVGRSFARLSKKDLPALLLQRVARIRSDKIDMGYLKEQVCSDYFTKYCDSVKTVTAIPHISPGDIKRFSIPLPPTKKEQTAIAQVLSDMNSELQKFEQKRDRYRQLKIGLMQQLLTGRIRLKWQN